MYAAKINQRFRSLNANARAAVREELQERVRSNHQFVIRQNSSLSWFTPRWYLWFMYHTMQGELNLMGYGSRPLPFGGFVNNPHYQELFARAGSIVEREHQRILRRVRRRGTVRVDLTRFISWTDEQFIMRPLARRTGNGADGLSRNRVIRDWTRGTNVSLRNTNDERATNEPCCAVCMDQIGNSDMQTSCCGQPAFCRNCLGIYMDLSSDSTYPVAKRCPLCNREWPDGPIMVPRQEQQ
uniref:RING-type domain-containing protein n=1 Tax=Clytia hemisphaerica TaxID=252671 RepID=A0A7M5WSB1_9CNID|eukprot:TCONS_00039796-protein